MYEIKLEVKKIKRSWLICQGDRPLSQKFRTEHDALADLEKRRSFYEYWAGSSYAASQYKPTVTVTIDL